MKKINLAITGCMGRMGQQLIKSSKSDKNFKLVALTENRVITEVPVSLSKEQKNLLEQFKKLEDSKTNPSIKNFFEKAKKFWRN